MEKNLPLKLHNSIAAVAPILGINFDHDNDRSKWTVLFKPEATDAQKAAAQAELIAFVPKPDPVRLTIDDVLAMLKKKGVLTDADIDAEKTKGK